MSFPPLNLSVPATESPGVRPSTDSAVISHAAVLGPLSLFPRPLQSFLFQLLGLHFSALVASWLLSFLVVSLPLPLLFPLPFWAIILRVYALLHSQTPSPWV